MYETIIEDYKKTIEELQQECTEMTSSILSLSEKLEATLQELCALKSIPEVTEELENLKPKEDALAQLKFENEELKLDNSLSERLLKDILNLFKITEFDWRYDQNEIMTELKRIKGEINETNSN